MGNNMKMYRKSRMIAHSPSCRENLFVNSAFPNLKTTATYSFFEMHITPRKNIKFSKNDGWFLTMQTAEGCIRMRKGPNGRKNRTRKGKTRLNFSFLKRSTRIVVSHFNGEVKIVYISRFTGYWSKRKDDRTEQAFDLLLEVESNF